eukprot:EG_transcript_1331
MGRGAGEAVAQLLPQLAPLLQAGLFNPHSTAIPILLSSRYDPVPQFWCAWPRVNEVSGTSLFLLYRASVVEGLTVCDFPCGDAGVVVEVLEAGFLGPNPVEYSVTQMVERADACSAPQLWRLCPSASPGRYTLVSCSGTPVYFGSIMSNERRLLFDSPLALEVAPAIVSACPMDTPLFAVDQQPSFLLLRFLEQQLGASGGCGAGVPASPDAGEAVALQRKAHRVALLMGRLTNALDALHPRGHPIRRPISPRLTHQPLLLGWVERRGPGARARETELAESPEREAEKEAECGDANAFVIAWLGPTRQDSILASLTLSDVLRWLRKSLLPPLQKLVADFRAQSLMPATNNRSQVFAANSDLTAIYRAAFIQELLWTIKAITATPEEEGAGREASAVLEGPLAVSTMAAEDSLCTTGLDSGPLSGGSLGTESPQLQVHQRLVDTHCQHMSGVIIPLLRRLQEKCEDASQDRGDREAAMIGLRWVAAWVGHYTCYTALWRHAKGCPELVDTFLRGFHASNAEQRLANLFSLTRLFGGDFFGHSVVQQPLDKTGSVWRVLSTALLHRTFFQPFAHPVPMPQNPASPFYTPMTIQRWYCEVDPDAMEVPISPDVLLDCHAIEGLAFPAPGPADLAPPETPTTPTLLLPHTATHSWVGGFESIGRGAQSQALAHQMLAYVGAKPALPRTVAALGEQPRVYATEAQLMDWRCSSVMTAWIYGLNPMLRSVLELQFGVLFEPLVSEVHLAGRRPVDIKCPDNFFTITQCNTMQWAVLPRYEYAQGRSFLHVLFRGTEGFMDILRDMTAASGTLHVIEGSTGCSVAVVNEWYVPLRVELLSIKKAMHAAARYLHMVSRLQTGRPANITMELTGHSLGGAYATILGWLYALDAPEFSQEELAKLGISDYRLVTFGQPPVVSLPSLEFLKEDKRARAIYHDFALKTTRVVRRLDPIPRPASAATELTSLLKLSQWHSNVDVAAANLRMFAHCGALVILSPDFDDSSGREEMRAMLLDDAIYEASLQHSSDVKQVSGTWAKLAATAQGMLLKVNEVEDHSISTYLDDLATARPGSVDQRPPAGCQVDLESVSRLLLEATPPFRVARHGSLSKLAPVR